MKLDKSLIVGLLGLASIAVALSARADTVRLDATSLYMPVAMAGNCPDAVPHRATDAASSQPVGSLALVLL